MEKTYKNIGKIFSDIFVMMLFFKTARWSPAGGCFLFGKAGGALLGSATAGTRAEGTRRGGSRGVLRAGAWKKTYENIEKILIFF